MRDKLSTQRRLEDTANSRPNRVMLLDDRGWNGGGIIGQWLPEAVESTARTVVGPDEPAEGSAWEQSENSHWALLEDKLRRDGFTVRAGGIRTLPHDVEMSERRHGLLRSPAN